MNHWYAIQTKAGQHSIAVLNLARRNFIVFCPLAERVVKKRGRIVAKTSYPLLGSYIFVFMDLALEGGWQVINRTRGVNRLLPHHLEEPLPVEDGLIESLQSRVNAGDFAIKMKRKLELSYKPGDLVPILGGVMGQHIGRFVRQQEDLVTLEIVLLGRELRVILPVNLVASGSGSDPAPLLRTRG